MEEKGFFAKANKCQFFKKTVEYLGHLVSNEGVRANPYKVSPMHNWPTPKNI